MPRKYSDEFKRDVIAVVRSGGVTQRQAAQDFGISKSVLSRWLQDTAIDDLGVLKSAAAGGQDAVLALRAAQKRIRLLEQEAEVMRRAVAYLSQSTLPK